MPPRRGAKVSLPAGARRLHLSPPCLRRHRRKLLFATGCGARCPRPFANIPKGSPDSEAICRTLRTLPAYRGASLICAFLSLPEEPSLAQLWKLSRAPAFCFPRLRDGGIELVRIENPTVSLAALDWRLDLPRGTRFAVIPAAAVDLFLVPGLAFTPRGGRLGRGGGFYDRLLAIKAPTALSAGICFETQILPQLPLEAHDVAVECVVTEAQLLPSCV